MLFISIVTVDMELFPIATAMHYACLSAFMA